MPSSSPKARKREKRASPEAQPSAKRGSSSAKPKPPLVLSDDDDEVDGFEAENDTAIQTKTKRKTGPKVVGDKDIVLVHKTPAWENLSNLIRGLGMLEGTGMPQQQNLISAKAVGINAHQTRSKRKSVDQEVIRNKLYSRDLFFSGSFTFDFAKKTGAGPEELAEIRRQLDDVKAFQAQLEEDGGEFSDDDVL